MLRKGEEVVLDIENVKFPNRSIIEKDGVEIRIKGGIKGQKVLAKISRTKKDYMEAKIVEVVEKSPLESQINCEHFGICGGCTYQNMSYEDELQYKKQQIEYLFQGEDLDIEFESIESSPNFEEYRNKMEFTFGDEYKNGPLTLGLHRKGRFYETVNVDSCKIVDEDFRQILRHTIDFFNEEEVPFYNKRNYKGLLRHLVVRKSLSKGEILINLVTTSQGEILIEKYLDRIKSIDFKGSLGGLLHTVNDGLGDVVAVDELRLIYGESFITEEILGLKFKISPFSFFQTNTFGAEKLYNIVREFAEGVKKDIVFDLYSGTGTIGQIMAPVAKNVYGIEIVEEAVEMAKENAKLNELTNVNFIAGDVFEKVDDLDVKPDLIVIDPPRDGIHPKAIDKIIDFNPETFIYVSCNPVTLTRDLKIFMEKGYKVKRAKLMDQFPRTPHVECVVLITK